jgi:hypothetical protein
VRERKRRSDGATEGYLAQNEHGFVTDASGMQTQNIDDHKRRER